MYTLSVAVWVYFIGVDMSKYYVTFSEMVSIEADSDDEAREIVAKRLDEILPSDGWMFGRTLCGEDMIDEVRRIGD